VLQKLGLAWDVKRIYLADVEKGLVAAPNGQLITPDAAESFAAGD
jgi:hypothetical protein